MSIFLPQEGVTALFRRIYGEYRENLVWGFECLGSAFKFHTTAQAPGVSFWYNVFRKTQSKPLLRSLLKHLNSGMLR